MLFHGSIFYSTFHLTLYTSLLKLVTFLVGATYFINTKMELLTTYNINLL